MDVQKVVNWLQSVSSDVRIKFFSRCFDTLKSGEEVKAIRNRLSSHMKKLNSKTNVTKQVPNYANAVFSMDQLFGLLRSSVPQIRQFLIKTCLSAVPNRCEAMLIFNLLVKPIASHNVVNTANSLATKSNPMIKTGLNNRPLVVYSDVDFESNCHSNAMTVPKTLSVSQSRLPSTPSPLSKSILNPKLIPISNPSIQSTSLSAFEPLLVPKRTPIIPKPSKIINKTLKTGQLNQLPSRQLLAKHKILLNKGLKRKVIIESQRQLSTPDIYQPLVNPTVRSINNSLSIEMTANCEDTYQNNYNNIYRKPIVTSLEKQFYDSTYDSYDVDFSPLTPIASTSGPITSLPNTSNEISVDNANQKSNETVPKEPEISGYRLHKLQKFGSLMVPKRAVKNKNIKYRRFKPNTPAVTHCQSSTERPVNETSVPKRPVNEMIEYPKHLELIKPGTSSAKNMFKCDLCPHLPPFHQINRLKHLRDVHKTDTSFKCGYCLFIGAKIDIIDHSKVSHPNKLLSVLTFIISVEQSTAIKLTNPDKDVNKIEHKIVDKRRTVEETKKLYKLMGEYERMVGKKLTKQQLMARKRIISAIRSIKAGKSITSATGSGTARKSTTMSSGMISKGRKSVITKKIGYTDQLMESVSNITQAIDQDQSIDAPKSTDNKSLPKLKLKKVIANCWQIEGNNDSIIMPSISDFVVNTTQFNDDEPSVVTNRKQTLIQKPSQKTSPKFGIKTLNETEIPSKYFCVFCGDILEDKWKAIEHYKTHLRLGYQCSECRFHSIAYKAMEEHLTTVHKSDKMDFEDNMTDDIRLWIEKCLDNQFKSLIFTESMRINSNKVSIFCPICVKAAQVCGLRAAPFDALWKVKLHICDHLQWMPMVCSLCPNSDLKFPNHLWVLMKHLNDAHLKSRNLGPNLSFKGQLPFNDIKPDQLVLINKTFTSIKVFASDIINSFFAQLMIQLEMSYENQMRNKFNITKEIRINTERCIYVKSEPIDGSTDNETECPVKREEETDINVVMNEIRNELTEIGVISSIKSEPIDDFDECNEAVKHQNSIDFKIKSEIIDEVEDDPNFL